MKDNNERNIHVIPHRITTENKGMITEPEPQSTLLYSTVQLQSRDEKVENRIGEPGSRKARLCEEILTGICKMKRKSEL